MNDGTDPVENRAACRHQRSSSLVRPSWNRRGRATCSGPGHPRFNHHRRDVSPCTARCSPTLLILASGFQHFGNARSTRRRLYGGLVSRGREPRGIAFADFNLDGCPDIVTANLALNGGSGAGIAAFLNNGNGTFGSPTTTATGAGAFDVVAEDFNRDGRPDVAVANADANTVGILLGSPAMLTPAFTWTTSASPRAVAADFTRDGRPDLAVAAYDCGCANVGIGQATARSPASPRSMSARPLKAAWLATSIATAPSTSTSCRSRGRRRRCWSSATARSSCSVTP
jgi:FG-GAP-like repeat